MELARFADDYVATDMAKFRRFENGLKLSIRGKIVSLRLQDMDSMVGTALIIEREIENARGIRDTITSGKRKGDQSSSNTGKRQRASGPREPQIQGQPGSMTCFYCHHPEHMKMDCPRRHDPRVMSQCRSSHQWNMHGLKLFLLTPVWVRGTSFRCGMLRKRLRYYRQA